MPVEIKSLEGETIRVKPIPEGSSESCQWNGVKCPAQYYNQCKIRPWGHSLMETQARAEKADDDGLYFFTDRLISELVDTQCPYERGTGRNFLEEANKTEESSIEKIIYFFKKRGKKK